MTSWEDPDPYTYERIGIDRIHGRPIYTVRLDGRCLGVIVPYRASTDTQIAGTRLRRQGRGRWEFARADYTGAPLTYTRRRDAARDLERWPMPDDVVARYVERFTPA